MPTGYTYNISNISFEDFVLQCSRAFLIHQRDEDSKNKPKLVKIEPYYSTKLEKMGKI